MRARFEELDWRATPMGQISLRRRLGPTLQVDVYEAMLVDIDDTPLIAQLMVLLDS